MHEQAITRNRHLVDRLADAKAEYDAAEKTYYALRDEVIKSGSLFGDEYAVEIKTTRKASLDRKALERHFGLTALSRFMIEKTGHTVTVRRRVR